MQNYLKYCLIGWLTMPFFSCQFLNKKSPLFRKITAQESGISFANNITETDSINILSYYYCYNGGGVAVGDLNKDGWQDLFFGGNMVSSRLYLNQGQRGAGPLHFSDITKTAGVTTTDWIMGVSLVDINNDDRLDIYLNVAGPTRSKPFRNLLFINQGNDSQGNPSFVESAADYGLADTPFSVQSAFLDYDGDGDLDMYLMTNQVDMIDKDFVHPRAYPLTRGATTDKLYQNTGVSDALGHPYFIDVSAQAGITLEGYGLGMAVDDLNGDGWPDIYVSNDFMTNDHLYINQQDGTFKDCSSQSQRHQSYNGMGVDVADINNDLLPDIMVVDMLPATNERRKSTISSMNYEKFMLEIGAGYVPQFMRNTLQLNRGVDERGVHFSDISQLAGINATDWSWGPLLADFDNDGLRDVYITNGFAKNITDLDFTNYQAAETMFASQVSLNAKRKELTSRLKGIKISAYLFKNKGNLTFSDQTETWGIDSPAYSNGAIYADLDNDGDLDLVTSNINETAFLFENQSSQADKPPHYLTCTLTGSPTNHNGVGAKVTVYNSIGSQSTRFSPVRGYLSSNTAPLHFGLGSTTRIDSLIVDWPDGKRQTLTDVSTNQAIVLSHRNAHAYTADVNSEKPLFSNVTRQYGLHYRHVENQYNDFTANPLLIRQYSKGGPGIAVGDVDNQNGQDFFVGGSVGNPGMLFRQLSTGKFRQQTLGPQQAGCDDMGALFFDADNDGDQDLYVASGGSEFKADAKNYQDRLYRNDGTGTFSRCMDALPAMRSSKGCVVGADYDRDGDIDLFVGGRYQPGAYPDAPRSYLLQNHKGTFSDVTTQRATALANVGMVSGAVWTDFDADGWIDLIVVGEWMPITFFKNKHGQLINVTGKTGLPDSRGWWNSIQSADIDNDGDFDYVVGNMGTNVDYKPSLTEPLELFSADFDQNGRVEPLLFCYGQNAHRKRELFPFYGRDDLLKQWVGLRRNFVDYASYGQAAIDKIIPATIRTGARHYSARMFETCIVENKGNGAFSIHALPAEAQFSSTFGILVDDFTGDGQVDLLLSGNSYASESLYGWQDASLGLILAGNGRGGFMPLSPKESGLFLDEDTKGLVELTTSHNETLLISVANADSLVALKQARRSSANTMYADPLDVIAEIKHGDGHTSRHEFQYGSGYLSQSSRTLSIPKTAQTITIITSSGQRRNLVRTQQY